jgi:hypothetical protein
MHVLENMFCTWSLMQYIVIQTHDVLHIRVTGTTEPHTSSNRSPEQQATTQRHNLGRLPGILNSELPVHVNPTLSTQCTLFAEKIESRYQVHLMDIKVYGFF